MIYNHYKHMKEMMDKNEMKSHTPLPQVIDMFYVHVVLSPYKLYTLYGFFCTIHFIFLYIAQLFYMMTVCWLHLQQI